MSDDGIVGAYVDMSGVPSPYWFTPTQLQEIAKMAFVKQEDKDKVRWEDAEGFRASIFMAINTNPCLAVAAFMMYLGDDEQYEEYKSMIKDAIKDLD